MAEEQLSAQEITRRLKASMGQDDAAKAASKAVNPDDPPRDGPFGTPPPKTPTPTGTAPKKPTSRLHAVKAGRLQESRRFTFYGVESVGKSSLAAAANKPIFIDVEDGSGEIDVPRYTFRDGPGGHVPRNIHEVRCAIRDLIETDHDYGTLVIDTLDRLESLIWQMLVERDSGRRCGINKGGVRIESIEDYGYGKGYIVALDEWRSLCKDLDELRQTRDMDIILLAHAQIRTFKNPEGEDYDRYNLRIDPRAAGFIKEWCHVVGFCCYEEGAGSLDPDKRPKGFSTGRRLVKLNRTAAYDGKSRVPLPNVLELTKDNPWRLLAEALEAGRDMTEETITPLIDAELQRIGDKTLIDNVNKAVATVNGDAVVLYRYLLDLRNRQPSKEEA